MLVVAVHALFAPPVDAAGGGAGRPTGSIRVSSQGAAHAVVRLAEPVSMRFDARDPVAWKTSGSFVGFAVERVSDGKLMVGGVRVPALDLTTPDYPARLALATGGRLSPGTYRIHVLSDGAAEVELPVGGVTWHRTYQATLRTNVSSSVLGMGAVDGSPVGRVVEDLALDEPSTILLASTLETAFGQATFKSICLGTSAEVCDAQPDNRDHFVTPGSADNGWISTKVYTEDDTGSGSYSATFDYASTGLVRKAVAFVLVLPGL